MKPPICPYCGATSELKDSSMVYGKSYGLIWICPGWPKCDSFVGVHKNSQQHVPLGRMANPELRKWKKLAHAHFDAYWRGKMARSQGYAELARRMQLHTDDAHIGMMDVDLCKKVVQLFPHS